MAQQLVTRIDDDLAAQLDELVASGEFANRSEAVRAGLQQLVDRRRRARIGSRIADAYRDRPQQEAEVGWADAATVRMIGDEPW